MVELTKQRSIYVGGTFDTDLGKGFRRTGIELVKKDLLYHIFTRRGDRVMMPEFGTDIQDMTFEPNDAMTQNRILGEIQTVIDHDPRVELIQSSIEVDEDNYKISVEVVLRFIELEIVETLNLDIRTN